jgi:hypothetical protein
MAVRLQRLAAPQKYPDNWIVKPKLFNLIHSKHIKIELAKIELAKIELAKIELAKIKTCNIYVPFNIILCH